MLWLFLVCVLCAAVYYRDDIKRLFTDESDAIASVTKAHA